MLYSKRSKSQIIMSEFLMAITIILVIIALSAAMWNRAVTNLSAKQQRAEMENIALGISDQFVRDHGRPTDWNETYVWAIGLAQEDNVLDPAKVTSFTQIEKESIKSLLGIGNYNFIFRLKDVDGEILIDHSEDPVNADEVLIFRRFVMYQGQPATMEFGLWK